MLAVQHCAVLPYQYHTSLRFSSAIVESAAVVVEVEVVALLLLEEMEGAGVDILSNSTVAVEAHVSYGDNQIIGFAPMGKPPH